jgi:homoserine/homoserine lactone efflux protein
MSTDTWLLFALTELALCISPGPAVLYVTSNALYRGFAPGVAAAGGVVTGNIIYFVLSALGVGALILAAGNAFVVVKWLGVGYLVWLGLRMWLGHSTLSLASGNALPRRRVYLGGVAVQLSNPKNLVFFIAILPPFIDPLGNVAMQVLILGVTSQVIEIAVLLGYGGVGAFAGRRLRTSGAAAWIDRAAGTLLIGAAVALVLAGRSPGGI